MKSVLAALVTLLLLSSCSTFLHRRTTRFEIKSDNPSDKVEVNNKVYDLPAIVTVKRSKENLRLVLMNDSTSKEFFIRPSLSPMFLFVNMSWTWLAPVGWLVDSTNPKRFYYGGGVVLSMNDTVTVKQTRLGRKYQNFMLHTFPEKKGTVRIALAPPFLSFYYFHPKDQPRKFTAGFYSASVGLEYFYKDSRYLSTTFGAGTDMLLAPVPDLFFEEAMHTVYVSLTDNVKINRFTLGYGLNYAVNKWRYDPYSGFEDETPPDDRRITETSHGLGVTLTSSVQLSKVFFAGIVYRPTLLKTKPETKFDYEHFIAIELSAKLRVRRK